MITNVLDYLENTASRFPDKTYLFNEAGTVTFRETMDSAKAIGTAIAGLSPRKKPIVVMMEKSVYVHVCFLGAAYAGCFYVPVDATLPKNRVNLILSVTNPEIIITDEKNMKNVEALDFSGKALLASQLIQTPVDEALLSSRRRLATDADPLYVVFTSGSTGVPKGVVTAHRSVIDLIENMSADFHITQDDVMGNQAPFDYDGSVKDIYNALKTGASIYIIPRVNFSFPKNLIDCLNENKITTLFWAVSAMNVPVNLGAFEYEQPKYLKKVLFSGAVMPCKNLKVWQQACPDAMFVNLYGPTETTCNCSYFIVDKKVEATDTLSIGRAYQNTEIILLKEDGTEAIPGEIGEICVRGTCLALGYYNNPEKTKEVFIQNPLNPAYPDILYKTGDLGEYAPDGSLIFRGRRDFQIKHMGHRIELGEIETAVGAMDVVDECCCLYNSEKSEIMLFYTGSATSADIVRHLRTCLPKFMFPSKFVALDVMPRQPNGKLNRVKLKEDYILGKN